MKNITIDILWYLINKLDPLSIASVDASDRHVNIMFKKRFYRKNEWTHTACTVNFWAKVNKDTQMYSEVSVYKNGIENNGISVETK